MKQEIKKVIREIFPPSVINFMRHIKLQLSEKVANREIYVQETANRKGLEIGGPSLIFKYQLPVYSKCSSLEFANFSSETVWEGRLSASINYFGNKSGKQHIMDATNLSGFADNEFEFVLSCNCLEHVANPLKALYEWKRVTSRSIILLLPKNDNNFDHRRSITDFEHILNNFKSNVEESDLTHLDEIFQLHDLSLDAPAGTFEQFKERSLKNFDNRCLHHHVFDDKLIEKMCAEVGLTVVEQSSNYTDWIFLIKHSAA